MLGTYHYMALPKSAPILVQHKKILGTNTLAYFAAALVTKRVYNIVSSVKSFAWNIIKLFVKVIDTFG